MSRPCAQNAATEARDAATKAVVTAMAAAIATGGGNVDTVAIVSAINAAANSASVTAAALTEEIRALRAREAVLSAQLAAAFGS